MAGTRQAGFELSIARGRRAGPRQRAMAWFFFVMAALFLLQTVVGGASHYRADLGGFFGIDIAQALPDNLVRVARPAHDLHRDLVHVADLPRADDRRSTGAAGKLAFVLLGALVIVVLGSLVGELAGVHGWLDGSIFGLQGFEYLDLGRFRQVLLIIGLGLWIVILFRGLRGG